MLTVHQAPGSLLGDAGVIELFAVSDTQEKYYPLDEGDEAVVSLTFTTTVSSLDVTPDEDARSLQQGNVYREDVVVSNLMDEGDMVNVSVAGVEDGGGWNMTLTYNGTVIWSPGDGLVWLDIEPGAAAEIRLEAWMDPDGASDPLPPPLRLTLKFSSLVTGEVDTFLAVVYPLEDAPA